MLCSLPQFDCSLSCVVFLYGTALSAVLIQFLQLLLELNVHSVLYYKLAQFGCKLCEEKSLLGSVRTLTSSPLVGEAALTLLRMAISLLAGTQILHSLRKKQL